MGWFGVVTPLKVTGNSTNRQSTYEFLLAFHSNYVPIVRYSQIFVENRRFNLPHLHLATLLGVPRWNFAKIFRTRKLEGLPFRMV